ncbi:signal peptidase I [Leucobacter sp. HY1908]
MLHAAADPVAPHGGAGEPAGEAGLWRAIMQGATWVLLIALAALAIALAVVPRVFGGQALTVLTGSMEPTYHPGDMVVVLPQERYRIGDAVTFQPVSGDPTLITHRVVGVSLGPDGARYTTRGDANGSDDDPIEAAQVMGRVAYSVPQIGHVALAFGEHRSTLIAIAGAGLLGYGAYAVLWPARGSKRARAADQHPSQTHEPQNTKEQE